MTRLALASARARGAFTVNVLDPSRKVLVPAIQEAKEEARRAEPGGGNEARGPRFPWGTPS